MAGGAEGGCRWCPAFVCGLAHSCGAAWPARLQVLMAVDKDEKGDTHAHQLMGVGYVPLTRPGEMEDGAWSR